MTLVNALPGAVAQGLIWAIMAIGVYITYRVLDIADLTVDGTLCTGGAVCIMCMLAGCNVWVAILAATGAGLLAGFVTGIFHTFMGIQPILAGILTQIAQIIFDIRKEENPCALCAKMRRGALHEAAKAAGCKKVALGHHFDDVVETYMLSLFYEGRISCFQPVTYLDRTGITLIRPLLYTPEYYVRSFAARHALPIVHNPCPADGNTKRQEIKDLLKNLEQTMPGLRERIFGAIQRYPLKGWAPDRTRTPKHPLK